MLMNCGECGSEVSDKAGACPKCGAPNSEFTAIETVIESPQDSKSSSFSPWMIGIVIGLVFLGLGIYKKNTAEDRLYTVCVAKGGKPTGCKCLVQEASRKDSLKAYIPLIGNFFKAETPSDQGIKTMARFCGLR